MVIDAFIELDHAVFLFINGFSGNIFLDRFMYFSAFILIYSVPLYLLYEWFNGLTGKKNFMKLFTGIIITFLFIQGLGHIYVREIPNNVYDTGFEISELTSYVNNPLTIIDGSLLVSDDSFPSNHMAVMLGFLIPLLWIKGISSSTKIFLVFAFLMGIGRTYVGRHFFLDYFGSLLFAGLGFLHLNILYRFFDEQIESIAKFFHDKEEKLIRKPFLRG